MSAPPSTEQEATGPERFVPLWPAEGTPEAPQDTGKPTTEENNSESGESQIERTSPFTLPHTSCDVTYVPYESELQMPDIVKIMKASLSEPYSIYTYRYFIHNWPGLCVLAHCEGVCVGAVVCKLERHHYDVRRGYIAMLAVDQNYRKRKIGENWCSVSCYCLL